MKLYAIAMMRDEEDVAEQVLLHLLVSGVDGIIVADNMSSDGTRVKLQAASDWAAKFRPEVDFSIITDTEVAYNQWRKMTALARMAGKRGATVVLPFDADEIWYADGYRSLKDFFLSQREEDWIFEGTMFNHVATSKDGNSGNPFSDLPYRRAAPWPDKKIAFRYQADVVLDQGNHKVVYPARKDEIIPAVGGLSLRHFQWRSPEQFLRKIKNGAEAYSLTDLPETIGTHWRDYGRVLQSQGEEAALKIFYDNFFEAEPDQTLINDPAPIEKVR